MTLLQIRNELGSRINQTDNSGNFVSTIVSTAESDRWINQAFEEVYMRYSLANREKFEQNSTFNIIADQNSYSLGGDAAKALAVIWLGIKFNTDDTDFMRIRPLDYPDTYYVLDREQFTQSSPKYHRTMQVVDTIPTVTLQIDPTPDASVTGGGRLLYIKAPAVLTADGDIPQRIPDQLHKAIIDGAAVNAFKKLGRADQKQDSEEDFTSKVEDFLAQDQSNKQDQNTRPRLRQSHVRRFYRRET